MTCILFEFISFEENWPSSEMVSLSIPLQLTLSHVLLFVRDPDQTNLSPLPLGDLASSRVTNGLYDGLFSAEKFLFEVKPPPSLPVVVKTHIMGYVVVHRYYI